MLTVSAADDAASLVSRLATVPTEQVDDSHSFPPTHHVLFYFHHGSVVLTLRCVTEIHN